MYRLMIRRFIRTTPLKSVRFSSSSSETKQESVAAFFENHGFSKSQISVILKKLPRLISANLEKSVLPKLLFFQSKGFSSHEVAKLVTSVPYILPRSLNRHIGPSLDYFHELLQSEEKTIVTIKRHMALLHVDLRASVRPNVEILGQFGVPHSNIQSILRLHPRVFSMKHSRFKETVEEVKEMGFNPLRFMFVVAVYALLSMSKSTWRKKVEVFRKWGLPEEEVLSAFGRHPGCMMASEDKINGFMDYFVNKIGCESSFIARHPSVLTHSLKSRIVPRGSVYLVLSSEGLIKKDVNLHLFIANEKKFLDKYIKPHEEHIPGLMKLYEEKLDIPDYNDV